MAAINCEQQEFALHSINDEYKNKTFVFVKLTDSALKSIQDYMSLNANVRQNIAKPTIQFNSNSNQGAITLPVNNPSNSNLLNENSSNNNKNEIRYSFNLSNVDADGPQGSFEFLRQRKTNKYEENIESLGSMFIKMQIHASDDIYQKTKVKMANAELDAKKHSTKVIKETGPNVGRKIKKTIINSSSSLGNTSNSNNNANSSINSNSNEHSSYSSYKDLLLNNLSNNVNSSNSTLMNGSQENNNLSPKSSANLHLHHTSTNSLSTKYNKSLTTTTGGHLNGYNKDETSSTSLNSINHMTSIKDNLTLNNSNINGVNCNNSNHNLNNTSERNSNNLNFTQSTNQIKSSTNPELLRKPVRDRVIHLLALRPYKKPEILAKLIRDGIREREKKGLGVLLSQIASLKDNAYHLNRGAWHEVQVDDWSFYTNEEREIVRKRNPFLNNNLNNNSNANNNNAISNNLSNSAMNKDNTLSPLANFESNPSNNSLPFNLPQSPMNSPSSSKRTIDLQTANSNILDYEYDYTKTSKKQRISHHKANNDAIKKKSPPLCSATSSTTNNLNAPSNSSSSNNNLSSTNSYSNTTNSTKKHPNTNTVLQTNKYHDVLNGWANKPKTPDEFSNSNIGHSNSNNSHSSPEINNSVNNFSSSSINGNKISAKSGLNNYCRNNINNGSANNTNERYQSNSNTNLNISYLHSNKDNNSHTSNSHYHINNHHNHQYHHSNNGNNNSSHHHSNHNNHHYGNHFNNSNQQQHSSSLCSTPNSSPDSGTGSNDGSLSTVSSRCSNSGNDQPDYLSKYTEITSLEQRRRYESDFNCEYEEYKKLHNFLDRNAYKFAQLEQELRQAQEGTDNWNRIMERIVREYEEIKRDSSYLNAKSRMQYLHIKLSHIKNLVLNYDNAQYRKQINNDSSSNLNSPNRNNNTNVKLNSSNSSTNSSRIRSKHHHSSVQQQSNRSKMMITTS